MDNLHKENKFLVYGLSFDDYSQLAAMLDVLIMSVTRLRADHGLWDAAKIVHGGSTCTDALAQRYAEERGLANETMDAGDPRAYLELAQPEFVVVFGRDSKEFSDWATGLDFSVAEIFEELQ